jgi:hypothetical protein
MRGKTTVIIAGALILAAFLLGYIPQYQKSRDLESQLNSTRHEPASASVKAAGDQLDLLIGYVYLETNQKNYGLASEASTKFFNRVRTVTGQPSDPNRQKFLQAALSKRDAVTGGLAKGDPGTLGAVQELFQGALETTQTDWK